MESNGIEHYRITVGSESKEMERYVQQCKIRKWAWHTFDWIKTKSPVHKAKEHPGQKQQSLEDECSNTK